VREMMKETKEKRGCAAGWERGFPLYA